MGAGVACLARGQQMAEVFLGVDGEISAAIDSLSAL